MPLAPRRVDHLNSALMLLTAGLTFVRPFELFLFAYAVLGPLHYLTEIAWLGERRFFVALSRPRRLWLALVAATMAALTAGFAAETWGHGLDPRFEITLVYATFAAALVVVALRGGIGRAWPIAAASIALLLAWRGGNYNLVAFLLVTVVHVFAFTAAFILAGALKARSGSAFLSLLVFATCATGVLAFTPGSGTHVVSDAAKEGYSSFLALNAQLMKLFYPSQAVSLASVYESPAGLAVMRFIAFAYTYHYLNWFSKTSIIRWHEVARRRALAVVGAWLLALLVYACDYAAGTRLLYALSLLHVLLEFPLNHVTFGALCAWRPARPAA